MIETERLVLRPFRESDAADVLEYLRKPAVNCFACMKLDSLEAAKDEMKRRAKDELYLAIVLKESGKVIGEIFAHPEGTDPEDDVMDTFSLCWMLNLNYTGKVCFWNSFPSSIIRTERRTMRIRWSMQS